MSTEVPAPPDPEHLDPRPGPIETLVLRSGRHRWLVLGLVLALAIAAVLAARHLELDALPDITGNQVVVLTRAPGLTPSEVERAVTRPVEVALGGLPGLEEQRSLSRYGLSSVTAVFADDVDPWLARQQVAERLATLPELPAGVDPPELAPYTGGLGEVFQLSVTSSRHTPAQLYDLVRLDVAPQLRATPGVVEVNVWGGERRTFDVVADPVVLASMGVDLARLAEALRESTGAVAGATLPAGPGQALLRGVHWPTTPAQLGAVTVQPHRTVDPEAGPAADAHAQAEPAPLRLAELATVVEGALPRIGAATANGRGETVYLMVQMLRDANALELMDRLHEQMPALVASLPEGVTIDIVYDRSVLVGATLRTVGTSLLEGAALVVLVLLLMLGSVRAGLLVAMVIPLSMLGALAGMVTLDVPGNLMSLGAIDFGLLVDGAVVMVERAFHDLLPLRKEADAGVPIGRDRVRATVVGSMRRVARPMVFSVLVIVLVYVPILTLQGVDGKMFRPMALTVVMALSVSLLLALTFTPAAAAVWLGPRSVPHRDPVLVRMLAAAYRPVLRGAMAAPALVLVLAAALLGVGAWGFASAGSSFVPQLDEGDLVIQTTRPPDVSIETAIDEAQRLERAVLQAAPEVRAVTSRIGSPEVATDIMGLEQADVFVSLRPREQWRAGLSRDELIAQIDEAIDAQAPGGEPGYTQPIQMRFNELIGGSVTDVSVSLYGEDIEAARRTAEAIVTAVQQVPGATDVRILAPPAVSMVEIRPNLLEATRLGLSAAQVLELVQALRVGVEVGATWDGPVRIPIRLRLLTDGDAFTVGSTPVATPEGQIVPLSRVADIVHLQTPALVSRQDAQRRVIVGFNVRGGELGDVVTAAQHAVEQQVQMPRGLRPQWGGQFAQLEEARARLQLVVPLVLLGIFGLLIAVFRALRPALVIFANVPFAGVGGVLALLSRDMPISISAAVGFIALSGIAVLNGVVLMSSLLDRQRAGAPAKVAAFEAARERMRPVMMTALVAALGFVPMALATGVGAEVQRPLATVVVGGLLSSTLLTLLILPSLYPWFAGRAARLGKLPESAT
ncbi:MAG: CusA/CzcA family heavy metal efflux RND transporter [Nannocystaceae bacterium]